MKCPPLQFFYSATDFFFMATILPLKVTKRRLFEKVSLECWDKIKTLSYACTDQYTQNIYHTQRVNISWSQIHVSCTARKECWRLYSTTKCVRKVYFQTSLTIMFQLQLESKSIFIHISINNHNRTIRVYLFLKVNLILDLDLWFLMTCINLSLQIMSPVNYLTHTNKTASNNHFNLSFFFSEHI